MSFIKSATASARKLPKAAWVAAVILPFGLVIVGTCIIGKSLYDNRKKK